MKGDSGGTGAASPLCYFRCGATMLPDVATLPPPALFHVFIICRHGFFFADVITPCLRHYATPLLLPPPPLLFRH